MLPVIFNDDNNVDALETIKLEKLVLLNIVVDVACKFDIFNAEYVDKLFKFVIVELPVKEFIIFNNVVDEGQNITHRQMELLLGRICNGTKMIVCGDIQQIDLRDKKLSGFNFISTNFKEVNGFSVVTLKTNHRDPIVEQILEIYKAHD